MQCLIFLANRFRVTAFPTDLLIIKPARAGSLDEVLVSRYPTKLVDENRSPLFVARAKSPLSVRRAVLASTGIFFKNPYAERWTRPLARRAAKTARPARVAIRARKPCFLARRRVFGWKVRFVMWDS